MSKHQIKSEICLQGQWLIPHFATLLMPTTANEGKHMVQVEVNTGHIYLAFFNSITLIMHIKLISCQYPTLHYLLGREETGHHSSSFYNI